MKKMITVLMTLILLCLAVSAGAERTPGNRGSITVRLKENLATRSGPSTSYTGCGSYQIKGSYVTALSRKYDNGGVLWVEIEFSCGGGYRRAWTGAKRLDISASQLASLPEADFSGIGYVTVSSTVTPRFGPGSIFAAYSGRDLHTGEQFRALAYENGYYLVSCQYAGEIMNCWIPASALR